MIKHYTSWNQACDHRQIPPQWLQSHRHHPCNLQQALLQPSLCKSLPSRISQGQTELPQTHTHTRTPTSFLTSAVTISINKSVQALDLFHDTTELEKKNSITLIKESEIGEESEKKNRVSSIESGSQLTITNLRVRECDRRRERRVEKTMHRIKDRSEK